MSEPAHHLHVVDQDGVIQEQCPSCAQLEDKLKGAERDLNTWRLRYAELRRDKLADAKASVHWPIAVRLFEYWAETTHHLRCAWTLDRFLLVEPFLKNKKYGQQLEDREALCRRAIDGYAFDCFKTKRRNGSMRRHDGWDLIFRDAAHFEEGVNKAPRAAA